MLVVVLFTRSVSASSNLNLLARPDDYLSAAEPSRNGSNKNRNYTPHKYTRDEWGDRNGGIESMIQILSGSEEHGQFHDSAMMTSDRPVFTAYFERIDRDKLNKTRVDFGQEQRYKIQLRAQTEPQIALFQHVAVQRINQTPKILGA